MCEREGEREREKQDRSSTGLAGSTDSTNIIIQYLPAVPPDYFQAQSHNKMHSPRTKGGCVESSDKGTSPAVPVQVLFLT